MIMNFISIMIMIQGDGREQYQILKVIQKFIYPNIIEVIIRRKIKNFFMQFR